MAVTFFLYKALIFAGVCAKVRLAEVPDLSAIILIPQVGNRQRSVVS